MSVEIREIILKTEIVSGSNESQNNETLDYQYIKELINKECKNTVKNLMRKNYSR